jgi:beta-lactamase regulating signal transducer with metallopeptidase domain
MGWAIVKAVSLAYLLGGLGLSLASVAWWLLRGRLAPARRADAGFAALAAASGGSFGLCIVIAVGVITRSIRMSTPYFHGLMSGCPALLITVFGCTVLLLSLLLVLRSALQARLSRSPVRSDLVDGVMLRRSAAVATASLVGVHRPELWVNPAYWDGLRADERQLVLHHERQHLRRRDNLRKLALHYISGLYFVLPWIRRWPRCYELDSEIAVDDACRRQLPEQVYVNIIAKAAGLALERSSAPVSSALTQAELVLRLQVLGQPRQAGSAVLSTAAVAIALGLSIAPGAALLHPVARCFLACYLGY